MKRSSRIIIILGIVLAVAAFGGVLFLSSNMGSAGTPAAPTTMKVVVAASDIPLGTTVAPALLGTREIAIADAPPDGYTEPAGLTGRVVRRDIRKGEALRSSDFSSGSAARGDDILRALKPGLRAMAIEVDQVTGVGTLIQPGDHVDIVLGFKVSTLWPGKEPGDPPSEVPGGPQLTVKLLVQNAEVLGTLIQLPEQQGGQTEEPADETTEGGDAGTSMTGQKQIVIVAVTAQQAEIVRYSQIQAADSPELSVGLVLRATADRDAPPDETTGVTIRELVEKYGVLPPMQQFGDEIP